MSATSSEVASDEAFQTACQRYAHGNGSSQAIAAAALNAARALATPVAQVLLGPAGNAIDARAWTGAKFGDIVFDVPKE